MSISEIEHYAMTLLAEEGAELAQASAQALRFGIDTPASIDGHAGSKLARLLSPHSKDNLGRRLAP